MTKRVLLVTLLAAAAVRAQPVDCLVAIVNGEIITLFDVKVAAEFGLWNVAAVEEGADPKMAALDALIDRKVVLNLAREGRGATKEEVAAAIAGLRRAIGEDAFAAKLGMYGLQAEDLEPYVEERFCYERALALRFSQMIPVSVTEVERYYRDIYVPEQARLGAAAEPLDRVAETIDARLREERRVQQTAAWVRDLRKSTEIQIKKDCLK